MCMCLMDGTGIRCSGKLHKLIYSFRLCTVTNWWTVLEFICSIQMWAVKKDEAKKKLNFVSLIIIIAAGMVPGFILSFFACLRNNKIIALQWSIVWLNPCENPKMKIKENKRTNVDALPGTIDEAMGIRWRKNRNVFHSLHSKLL